MYVYFWEDLLCVDFCDLLLKRGSSFDRVEERMWCRGGGEKKEMRDVIWFVEEGKGLFSVINFYVLFEWVIYF